MPVNSNTVLYYIDSAVNCCFASERTADEAGFKAAQQLAVKDHHHHNRGYLKNKSLFLGSRINNKCQESNIHQPYRRNNTRLFPSLKRVKSRGSKAYRNRTANYQLPKIRQPFCRKNPFPAESFYFEKIVSSSQQLITSSSSRKLSEIMSAVSFLIPHLLENT